MSIGPGRPGDIKPPGHPFFASAKEMKTHFVLLRPVFETPLNTPARPIQCRAQTVDNCSKVTPFSNGDFRAMHSSSKGLSRPRNISPVKRPRILHLASGSRFRITGAMPTLISTDLPSMP
jgi:hypothetical protein